MERRGFEVTLVAPERSGRVSPESVLKEVREDTLLVSVMTVNNETGVIQPVVEIAEGLSGDGPYFHTDAAQAYAKLDGILCHPRIDMISVSGHKIKAPMGVGSLILKRRQYRRAPVKPLMLGGGQERGLRPGTVPVPLVAGFGLAAERQVQNAGKMQDVSDEVKRVLNELGLHYTVIGSDVERVSWIQGVLLDGVDSEAAIIQAKEIAAISNGAACTASTYSSSHVIRAMGFDQGASGSALRFSI